MAQEVERSGSPEYLVPWQTVPSRKLGLTWGTKFTLPGAWIKPQRFAP